ncbi:MAG: helix-turn-helix domain-containing protein [Lactobacillus sp.]|jgi:hypothetical protein|nr:helix-turn-helix domain-containing protein [Lactobacillus sp.]
MEYFTYKQAMQYLGISSYKGLRSLIKEGLPVIQINSSKRISKHSIDKFMDEHQTVAN